MCSLICDIKLICAVKFMFDLQARSNSYLNRYFTAQTRQVPLQNTANFNNTIFIYLNLILSQYGGTVN